jgi:hypothetical protein
MLKNGLKQYSYKMGLFNKIKQAAKLQHQISEMKGTEVVGTFGGHTLRKFKSIEYLPASRYLAFLANSNEAELGVSNLDLKAFVKGMQDSINANELTKAAWYVETLKFYMETHAPERMLFKTGSVLLLLDDEKPEIIDEKAMENKALLFDTNDEFRAFFLQTLYRSLKAYGILQTGINEEDFLRVDRSPVEKIFSTLTGRATYSDYLKE